VQSKKSFEQLEGQDFKMRLIEEFIVKDDAMHQRVCVPLAHYNLQVGHVLHGLVVFT
jgi:hypothetical protein